MEKRQQIELAYDNDGDLPLRDEMIDALVTNVLPIDTKSNAREAKSKKEDFIRKICQEPLYAKYRFQSQEPSCVCLTCKQPLVGLMPVSLHCFN